MGRGGGLLSPSYAIAEEIHFSVGRADDGVSLLSFAVCNDSKVGFPDPRPLSGVQLLLR